MRSSGTYRRRDPGAREAWSLAVTETTGLCRVQSRILTCPASCVGVGLPNAIHDLLRSRARELERAASHMSDMDAWITTISRITNTFGSYAGDELIHAGDADTIAAESAVLARLTRDASELTV